MKFLTGLAIAAMAMLSLAGCVTTGLTTAISVATGASISSGKAITVADGFRTIEDVATAYQNGCVAAGSTTGACAYGDQAYQDATALETARDNVIAFAKAHGDVPLGVGGDYALAMTALSTLESVLNKAGVAYVAPATS